MRRHHSITHRTHAHILVDHAITHHTVAKPYYIAFPATPLASSCQQIRTRLVIAAPVLLPSFVPPSHVASPPIFDLLTGRVVLLGIPHPIPLSCPMSESPLLQRMGYTPGREERWVGTLHSRAHVCHLDAMQRPLFRACSHLLQ